MSSTSRTQYRKSIQFWLLATFLVIVFLTGGASRIDVSSLIILRPLSVILCAVALLTITRDQLREGRALLILFAALFGLALLHVVPLPPALWQMLPGRAEIAAIDQLAKIGDVWRPLTLTPANGWHALTSLFAPLAVVLLGLQLGTDDRRRLLPLIIAMAVLSGVLGILQIIGSTDSPLYTYRITSPGWALGLFANRNHGALLLAMLLPMLAVYAASPDGTHDQQGVRRLVAIAIAAVVFPIILVSGSRAGLFLAVLGLATAALIYRRPADGRPVRRGERRLMAGLVPVAAVAAIVTFAALMIVYSRAKSLDRLLDATAAEETRFDYWVVAVDMLWKYFPFGSGSGSFAEAYQIVEPDTLLNLTYLNRAHNDWLEVAVTFGLPGMIVMVVLLLAFVRRAFRAWSGGGAARRPVQFARLATVLLLMIALASIPDYPLRTPIMMCLAAVCGLWLLDPERGERSPALIEPATAEPAPIEPALIAKEVH